MRSVKEVEVRGKRVLVRVDFNVPLKNNRVVGDERIRASLPTIKLLLKKKATVILVAHLGRPKGKVVSSLRLKPVAARLSRLLKQKVKYVSSLENPAMSPGEVALLENIRFHHGEEKNSASLARTLASFADVYVNEAFSNSHRKHASMHAITKYLPSYAGLLLEKEVKVLSALFKKPKRPVIAIMGGGKVGTKIGVIRALQKKVDAILIGGALMFTFYKALGWEVGKSRVEKDKVKLAKQLLKHKNILLPIDVITAFSLKGKPHVYAAKKLPKNQLGVDIGPETRAIYAEIIKSARTVFWNGPVGFFEYAPFRKGTATLAKALAECKGTTVIGGGDLVDAIEKLLLTKKLSHVSTGGGAALEFIEGKKLPGITALK